MNLQSDFISPTPANSSNNSADSTTYNLMSNRNKHCASNSPSRMTNNSSPLTTTTSNINQQSQSSFILSNAQNNQIRPSYITINNNCSSSSSSNQQSSLSSSPSSNSPSSICLNLNYVGGNSSSSSSDQQQQQQQQQHEQQHQLSQHQQPQQHHPVQLQPQSSAVSVNKNLAQQIVDLIRLLNIKLIAFDFDCTIVTIHTGGQWIDSPEKLAEFVRPCFRELLPVLLKSSDLNVCVVTYSPQEKLIREVLRISLEDENEVNYLVSKIIIKGNTKEFLEQHGIELCYTNGKQIHLDYCRNIISKRSNTSSKIEDSNILLIDDDIQNLRLAVSNGHYAFQVNNTMKLAELYNYLKDRQENLIY